MLKEENKIEKTSTSDRTIINIYEDYEVMYWSKKFDVSPEKLRTAAAATGSNCLKMSEIYLQANK